MTLNGLAGTTLLTLMYVVEPIRLARGARKMFRARRRRAAIKSDPN